MIPELGEIEQLAAVVPEATLAASPCWFGVTAPDAETALTLSQACTNLVNATTERPWLAPLVESVIGRGSEATASQVYTDWSETGSTPDAEKDAAYQACVREAISKVHPSLWRLFEHSAATVGFGPGHFMFLVPTRPGAVFTVSELVPYTYLVPFKLDGEPVQ